MVEGFKNTEVGVIPSDWLLCSVEDTTPQNRPYSIVDGPFGSNLKTIHYRKSGIPIITSGYVTDGKFFAKEYLYVDLKKFKQEKRSAVRGGDIVMAKIGERCGASAILPGNHQVSILSGNALKITIDENRFSKELISQILWHHHVKGAFQILRTTGAQPAISISNLRKYKIPLPPSLAEQTAIATALSDADALINELEQLLTKKRNIKTGAMQELLRPKEGWVVKKLGEIGKTYGGLSGKSKDDFQNGVYPYIPFMNIMSNPVIDTTYFDLVNIGNSESQNKALKGDLFFNGSSETPEEVGMCSVLQEHIANLYLNSFCFGFRLFDTDETNGLYLSYFFRCGHGRKLIFSLAQGATRYNLSKTNFLKLELGMPSPKEQTRIAQILSDMDNEIEELEKQIEKYKMLKQGMMQNLLTGKIRLV